MADPMQIHEPATEAFDRQLEWLKKAFDVVPLAEGVRGLESGVLPGRPLAITFDDGYADNLTLAAPVLVRHGLPATFFVASGYLDGGIMWNDVVTEAFRETRRDSVDLADLDLGTHPCATLDERCIAAERVIGGIKYLPSAEREALAHAVGDRLGVTPRRDLMMTADQLAQLAETPGMDIGGHTVTHPILARVSLAEAEREIVENRRQLGAIIGRRIDLFAYPNGLPGTDYGAEHVRLLRELDFDGAVCTAWGASTIGDDPFQIRRFTPRQHLPHAFSARLARNLWARGNPLVDAGGPGEGQSMRETARASQAEPLSMVV